MTENTQAIDRPDIRFKPVNNEVVKTSDRLLVDPDYFKGQYQTDSDLCNYLALAAQVHMCTPNNEDAERSKLVMKNSGLKRVAEMVRKQVGEARLSTHQAESEFKDRTGITPIYGATGLKQAGLMNEGENVGYGIARAISGEGMLPSVLLFKEDHMVLGIGTSGDGKEIIAWDALMGKGDPKLRRISVDRDDLGMNIAAKINPVFKK